MGVGGRCYLNLSVSYYPKLVCLANKEVSFPKESVFPEMTVGK